MFTQQMFLKGFRLISHTLSRIITVCYVIISPCLNYCVYSVSLFVPTDHIDAVLILLSRYRYIKPR
jgi:hypothetical protein